MLTFYGFTDVILDIYSACRYDKAWNYTATSPWCAPFHKEDLKIMEYYQDLKHYYRTGYGNDLSYKVGCPIVKDLIDRFNRGSGSQETSTPKGVFYFVHSDTLRPVLVRLGVAKDAQPPRHDNYHQMSKRQWRTSQVSPFAGNIAAVFYKCHGNYGEENKVMFYLNEHNVDYEGCDVGLCEWSYIKKKFENVISQDSCSYKFCETAESSAPTKYTINLSLIPVVLFLLGKVL
ncbi:hypothetical protein AAG570_005572 [Ranatra chinensis]|uniref:Multiple inositol polyphosphate phosphatase 1 n=1 Tax=Ranatra chinensis TaxID=642074 RepID=A0ABD0XXT9_9HEMI